MIDLYEFHLPYDSVNGTHPTAAGMNTLATLVLHSICGRKGLRILENSSAEHEFIVSEKSTDRVKYNYRECTLVDGQNLADPDIIDLEPNVTKKLYAADAGIQLFHANTGKDLTIDKTKFCVGRQLEGDLHLNSSVISRVQATFLFDGIDWTIQDNRSTNGTWLNGIKLLPDKKYILHPNDVIDFAHTEKFLFFKTRQ